jgi:hypothetical protein
LTLTCMVTPSGAVLYRLILTDYTQHPVLPP